PRSTLFPYTPLFRSEIRLDHFGDEILTRLARLRFVGAPVGNVVGQDADAEERDLEQPGDLRRRRGFHFFRGGAEPGVEILDAIELAVPDFTRSKVPFDDLSSFVPVADAARRREQSSV